MIHSEIERETDRQTGRQADRQENTSILPNLITRPFIILIVCEKESSDAKERKSPST